jgi:prolyl-tRNA synthetase
MPALQPKSNWEKTDRWDNMDNLFKFESFYSKIEYALGPTHEEIVTPLLKKFINSYKDLPKVVYQFQSKFRDEKRAKSGLLRGREFLMKDCYSFHQNTNDLNAYYEIQLQAYKNIFEKM